LYGSRFEAARTPGIDGRRVGVGFGVPVTGNAGFDYELRTMVLLHL
jgi:hypothetical protein